MMPRAVIYDVHCPPIACTIASIPVAAVTLGAGRVIMVMGLGGGVTKYLKIYTWAAGMW